MPTEEVDWHAILPPHEREQARTKTRAEKIWMVISLILYLKLPLAPLILCLFETDNEKVKQLSGNFLRGTSVADPETDMGTFFPAAKLYSLWHGRFKTCREKLHKYIVEPCAKEIIEAESNAGIRCPDLKVTLTALTMKDIKSVLNPGTLLQKYMSLFPFMYSLLMVFCASPNRHRKYNIPRQQAQKDTSAQSDDAEDAAGDTGGLGDDGLEDDELLQPEDEDDVGWTDWRKDPRWKGFSRCPLHVRAKLSIRLSRRVEFQAVSGYCYRVQHSVICAESCHEPATCNHGDFSQDRRRELEDHIRLQQAGYMRVRHDH